MKSKGITPVIAIVLLLLITVGAVGVVYTQFEELTQEGPDTSFLEDVDVDIQVVTREASNDPDTMKIRMENTGDEEYNLNESLRMEFSVPGEQKLEPDINSFGYDYDSSVDNHCLEELEDPGDASIFSPGDVGTCDTGFEMPSPGDRVEIHLVERGSGDEADSYTCSPSTSSSITC